jgi:hypothetical protein
LRKSLRRKIKAPPVPKANFITLGQGVDTQRRLLAVHPKASASGNDQEPVFSTLLDDAHEDLGFSSGRRDLCAPNKRPGIREAVRGTG